MPAHPSYQIQQNSKYTRRPLPKTPGVSQKKTISFCQSSEGSQIRNWRKEPLRRATAHSFPLGSHWEQGRHFYGDDGDHIYEEIEEDSSDSENSDDSKNDSEENSFLSLISSERRQNLRYYGCTSWDFGTEHIS